LFFLNIFLQKVMLAQKWAREKTAIFGQIFVGRLGQGVGVGKRAIA
jgi:hypothetical protein